MKIFFIQAFLHFNFLFLLSLTLIHNILIIFLHFLVRFHKFLIILAPLFQALELDLVFGAKSVSNSVISIDLIAEILYLILMVIQVFSTLPQCLIHLLLISV